CAKFAGGGSSSLDSW
nr:immunoglobulin heavy chain junction region [Macaca mulatta]MOW75641.1 immunoglobulin heavy chain junction region [Macaca mulatta]MOW78859.1 immunoglobulin heavy chain junction region [Macaca mulatta]MOW80795.1 immunoglobulin heavy chain junction region [Macaca mulatta]MOW81621.1 immunoglobulin heavy chain junction region [Macaca mulatta]